MKTLTHEQRRTVTDEQAVEILLGRGGVGRGGGGGGGGARGSKPYP